MTRNIRPRIRRFLFLPLAFWLLTNPTRLFASINLDFKRPFVVRRARANLFPCKYQVGIEDHP